MKGKTHAPAKNKKSAREQRSRKRELILGSREDEDATRRVEKGGGKVEVLDGRATRTATQ